MGQVSTRLVVGVESKKQEWLTSVPLEVTHASYPKGKVLCAELILYQADGPLCEFSMGRRLDVGVGRAWGSSQESLSLLEK